jgi:hypothetical protein
MHMVVHRARNADAAGRAFGLEPGRHVDAIAVQVGAIRNCVADVDPDAEPDGAIGRLLAVAIRNLLLHRNGTAHGPVYAIEYDQQ